MSIVKTLLKLIEYDEGQSIFERTWDHLIILDACRYDSFVKVAKEYGINKNRIGYNISLGSDTTEFLRKNFQKMHDDVVYVTANPFVNMIAEKYVYRVIPVWLHEWDGDIGTVRPEAVYYYALRTFIRHPSKRLIVHFIQPHYPYINYPLRSASESFESLRKEALKGRRDDFSPKIRLSRILKVFWERKIYPIEFYIAIDESLHRKAYEDNLRLVMPYALKLAKLLPGKVVITADHGEAFGEKLHTLIPIRVYGHLPEIHIEPLVKVPWLEIENNIGVNDALKKAREELRSAMKLLMRTRVKRVLRKWIEQ